MFITRKWLEKYIDLNLIKDEEITVALNSLGFEVDSYKTYNGLNDNLRIGHVGNVRSIEGTHLKHCFVDINNDMPSSIVCGAKNVKEGQFVLVAEPGTKIANGLTILEKEIKGVSSEGMICALSEIGMNKNLLNDKEKEEIYEIVTREDGYSLIGKNDALELIGFNDSVWECDLTLNRSDALGAIQVAKELANYFKIKFSDFDIDLKNKTLNYESEVRIKLSFKKELRKLVRSANFVTFTRKKILTIDNNWIYRLYSEDDLWLKNCGVKKTNSFFEDFSNIIAIETGQPIIILDASKIKGDFSIDLSINNDNKSILVLKDGNKKVCDLGMDVEPEFAPNDDTSEFVILFLSLDPILMRKQLKETNTSNISMQRYMKPISSRLYKIAYKRLIWWLDKYDLVDKISEIKVVIDSDEKNTLIKIEQDFIDKLLGFTLNAEQIKNLFINLNFKIDYKNGIYNFEVDEARTDISMKADIVEEIARLYGYDNIEAKAPIQLSMVKKKQLKRNVKNYIESLILGQGFANIKTYSLISRKDALKWDLFEYKNPINLMSPLSLFRETYRLSLFTSLIETVIFNSNKGNKDVKLYEFVDIYNNDNLRKKHLGLIISGDIMYSKAHKIELKNNWYYLKGLVESILKTYQLDPKNINFSLIDSSIEEIHPYLKAKICYELKTIGFLFKLNPLFEEKNKINSTFLVDLDLSEIENIMNKNVEFRIISKYQKSTRDISFVLKSNQNYKKIIEEATEGIENLQEVTLSDMYQNDELLSRDEKSYTITITFNSNEKQITDETINKEFNKIIDNLSKKGIVIR